MSVTAAAARSIARSKADDFTGDVLLDTLITAEGASLLGATYVTFTPGARSVWHSHVNRQVLVVTAGWGVLQVRGEVPQLLQPGDVAAVPAGIEHWHGATPTSTLTHLALLEAEGDGTTWLEPVADEDYRAAADDLAARA